MKFNKHGVAKVFKTRNRYGHIHLTPEQAARIQRTFDAMSASELFKVMPFTPREVLRRHVG